MKRFYIILLILSSFITANAQMGLGGGGSKIVGRISGTVIDSVTKKPVDYASVGLYHSGGKSPITGVITDEKGNFRLDNVAAGNYKLVITFIGYPDKVIDPVTTTASKPDFNLGQIQFAPSRRVLKEVQITGQAALVENKIDKIVYNAEKDITAGGGSATDILQKVPLVSVDINGNVSLRGDQNVRVLINGKPSGATAASLSDVLKGIPADQIKSVEVITSPSAKYDAEGSAGIINIITKSKNISGLSGTISGGVGTRQNNGNLNLNYKKNRFDFTANIGGNAGWPQTSLTEFSQRIIKPGDTTYSHSEGTSRVTRHAVIGSLQAGYEFNAYNSISSTLRLNQIQFNTNSSSVSTGNLNYSSNTIAHAIPASGFDWSVDYTHKFKKEGEELDLSTQWTHSIGKTDFVTRYTGVYRNQKDNIDGTNNEYTLQLDYTLPINPVFKLETGGKYIMRRISADNNLYSPNGDDFIYNTTASNIYDYNQNVAAGYMVWTINLSKTYSILAGIRDEYTSIDGNPVTPAPGIIATNQGYNTFVPSLTLQKKLSATQTIKLAYSKRITRPSLQFLNPYTDSTNVQAQKVGNPALNAEVTQTVELDYNTFIGSSVLNFSAYYKHTAGLIEGIATPLANPVTATDSVTTITKYQNIGNNNSWGGSIFGSVTPFKILTIMGNINAYTYKPDPSGLFIFDQSKNGTYIQYSGFLRGSLSLPHDLVAEAFAFGSSSRRTIQGSNPSFSMFGVGVKKQFDKKKWSLGVNAFQPFSNYKVFASNISSPVLQQSSRFQLPFRSFGLTFSYSFGKLNFSNPMQQQKKGVNNDDLKQGDQGMGGGGGGGR